MINQVKFPTESGMIFCSVFYTNGDKKVFLNNLFHRPDQADNFLDKMSAKILRETVSKFVNHREKIITQFGGEMTQKKLNAISEIRKYLDFRKNGSLKSICQLIIQLNESLITLLPSVRSEFYEHDVKLINNITSYSQNFLNHG